MSWQQDRRELIKQLDATYQNEQDIKAELIEQGLTDARAEEAIRCAVVSEVAESTRLAGIGAMFARIREQKEGEPKHARQQDPLSKHNQEEAEKSKRTYERVER